MLHTTNCLLDVNTVTPKFFLDYDPDRGPVIRHPNGNLTAISNDDFGRWLARVLFPNMAASPAGATWFKRNNPTNPIRIPGFTAQLRQYQHLTLFRMLISSCGLFLDMGLGKTIIALAYCVYMHATKDQKFHLIVCPPTCFIEWQKHIDEFVSAINTVCIAHGRLRKKEIERLRFDRSGVLTFILTSYETLISILPNLSALPIQSIFLDEAARIKNLSAQRTRTAFALKQQHPDARRFLLTGTPSTKNFMGFYSLLEWLDTGASGCPNFTIFEQTYSATKLFMRVMLPGKAEAHVMCEPEIQKERWLHRHKPAEHGPSYYDLGFNFGWNAGPKTIKILNHYRRRFGNKNTDQLNQVLQRFTYTLHKTEVLKELPPKTFCIRTVILKPTAKKAYDDLIFRNATQLANEQIRFNERQSPWAKLHQIANGFLHIDEQKTLIFEDDPKLDALEEIIDSLGDQKLVIWSPYLAQIDRVSEHLAKLKFQHVVLHGEVSMSERMQRIEAFQDNEEIEGLVANPEVGGFGLNLQCASVQVFMSNWWKADTRVQAIDRLHRSGQQLPVLVIDLLAEDTVEAAILKDLNKNIDAERAVTSFDKLKKAQP